MTVGRFEGARFRSNFPHSLKCRGLRSVQLVICDTRTRPPGGRPQGIEMHSPLRWIR